MLAFLYSLNELGARRAMPATRYKNAESIKLASSPLKIPRSGLFVEYFMSRESRSTLFTNNDRHASFYIGDSNAWV